MMRITRKHLEELEEYYNELATEQRIPENLIYYLDTLDMIREEVYNGFP